MRREIVMATLPAAAVMLGACSGVGQGTASYDALQAADRACHDRGGELQLRNGYDGHELSNYDCVGARR
jgi:hypothetical protein